jgi:glycosyltransferase involved in cell wall biosynthesis
MSRSVRVLIMVENLPVPFDRRVWLEATTLTRHGYRVSVICPKGKGFDRGFEVLEGVRIHRYGLPVEGRGGRLGFFAEFLWSFLMTAWLSLRVAVTGPGFDVIQACNPPDTFWLIGRFWKLFGCRFIFDHHDLSPEMYAVKFGRADGFLYQALLWLERRTFRTADVVIATNESHRTVAVSRGGVSPDAVYVVRSGPDTRRFRAYPPEPRYLDGKRHLLVYLGEMCEQDGVDYLVRAVKLLRDQLGRTDFRCLFVGGGPHQPEIKAYAEAQGIMDVAAFTGTVSDEELCRILSTATIGIDPDPKNPWSDKSTMNKIIEYLYFGLPVVAFDLHETRISAGDAAVYAEANSELAMARAVSLLLDDPDRRAAMSELGRARVRDTLAWNHSEAPLLAAYTHQRRGRGAVAAGSPVGVVTHPSGR